MVSARSIQATTSGSRGMPVTNINSIRNRDGGWIRPSMRQGELRPAETAMTVSARQKDNEGGRHDYSTNDAGGDRTRGAVFGRASRGSGGFDHVLSSRSGR